MIKSLLAALVIILVFIGIASIIYYISLRILSHRCSNDYTVIIPATSKTNNIASRMYSVRMQLNLIGEGTCAKVLVVDYGMSEETRRLCTALCRESNGMYLCKSDEINNILSIFNLQK